MTSPRVAVLLRTYGWDDYTFRSAVRMWDRCGGLDFYILADETNSGPLDTGPFRKLAHVAADFEAIGLPCAGPSDRPALWWNCDYGFYDAVLKLPDYDYYLFLESDVAVNLDLRPMIERIAAEGLDCVTCLESHKISQRWPHAWSCADLPYARPSWTALCIVLGSHRTLRHLLMERQKLGEMLAAGQIAQWPFCEGFFCSALLDAGLRLGSLQTHADLSHFATESIYLEGDPQTRVPGTLCHAVLDPDRAWDKFIARGFRSLLGTSKVADLRRIRESLLRIGRPQHEGWRIRPSEGNLALDRPARQSSLSSWSRKPHRRNPDPVGADARGANSGVLTGSYGFHTDLEDHPWWAVDLERACNIDEIRIYNSAKSPERARHLIVQASYDGDHWFEIYRKSDDRIFLGNDDPLVCPLLHPVSARQVRVVLDGTDFLSLAQIEVLGSDASS